MHGSILKTEIKMSDKIEPRSERIANLKKRVLAVRNLLPKNFISIIVKKYPAYDNLVGGTLILNIINLRSSSEEITVILEQIATDYQSSLTNLIKRS